MSYSLLKIKEEEQNDVSNLDLIKSISQTLSSIVENSKKQNNYKEILKKQMQNGF